jgi:hypothetical protein
MASSASAAAFAAFAASTSAFAASAASASALRLASNASINAGRGFGRFPDDVGTGTGVVAIGPAGGVRNGAGETAKNENDGMGPMPVSRSGVREAAKREGITGALLSLRLRRGGVLAGGTAAVRAAVEESFVTSMRGKASE